MSKTNQKKTWAEAGLEEVQQEVVQVQLEAIPTGPPAEEELEQVSGMEPIVAYYQDKPYTGTRALVKPVLMFEKGAPIRGTFIKDIARDQKTKDGRKFVSHTYLLRKDEDGKVYGLQSSSLRKGFEKLKEDDKVIVTYTGHNTSKTDGRDYPNFLIFRVKQK